MSVQTEIIITCNGESPNCEGSDWSADSRYKTAKEQRLDAKQRGWHQVRSEDFCAACWEYRKALLGGKKA